MPLVGDVVPLAGGLAALLVVAAYGPANLSRSQPRTVVQAGEP